MNTTIQIGIGCLASLAAWWLINAVFVPRLHVGNIQFTKKKTWITLKNWTFLNAYDVLFVAEFREDNDRLNSYSSRKRVQSIERFDTYRLELPPAEKHKCVDTFYNTQNGKNTLIVTATYQNKFGTRTTIRKKYTNKKSR